MRHIEKGGSPDVLTNDGARFQRDALEFALTATLSGSSPYEKDLKKFATYNDDGDFDNYSSGLFTKRSFYSDPDVKRRLIVTHHGKCAYCECFIMDSDSGDVEHFRPKAEVTTPKPDNAREEITVAGHPGYFWLAADWKNLFLSCKQCNQANKRNFFDLYPTSPRENLNTRTETELPNLLSPDLPEKELRRLIRYNPTDAKVLLEPYPMYGGEFDIGVDLARIKRTIDIVGLNRPRLIEARANHLIMLRALFVLATIKGTLPPDHKIPEKTDLHPAILDFVAPDNTASKDAIAALERAIAPSAEFSALAIDALITWSLEVKLSEEPASVSLVEPSAIRLVTEQPRLRASLDLALKIGTDNKESIEGEAEADITDLDAIYSAQLLQYKAAIKKLNRLSKEFKRTMPQVRKDREKAEKYFMQHLSKHDDLCIELEARIRGLLRDVNHETPDACLITEELKEYVNDNYVNLGKETPPKFSSLIQEDEELQAAASASPLKFHIDAHNGMIAKIAKAELPIQALASEFRDIHEELVDLKEGYRVRGIKATRLKRCEDFENALSNVIDWLDNEEEVELASASKQHLAGKGYPPAIRR